MSNKNQHSDPLDADAQDDQGKRLMPSLGAIPRYFSAVLSQGLVSGFHFGMNLMLVRLLPAVEFGIFALTFVVAVIVSSVSNALASTPLCVYAPGASSDAERRRIESLLTTIMVFLLGSVVAGGLMFVAGGVALGNSAVVLLAALAFVTTYLARQYSRSFGYARFDVIAVLRGDIVYVATGCIALAGMLLAGISIGVTHVLLVLSAGNLLAVVFEVNRLQHTPVLSSIRQTLTDYASIWQQTRWALIGAITTVIVSQAHSLVVSVLKGPAAFAPLAAGFVIFGPVRVIFTTIQNVIKPEMALAIAMDNSRSALRQTVMASAISMLAVAGLAVMMTLAWPWLDHWLYAEHYSEQPMQMIVYLWAAITFIGAAQNGPFAALQSLREFRSLALATVYGSILSVLLVTMALLFYPVHFSIFGILLAETFVMLWVVRLTAERYGHHISVVEPVRHTGKHEV